MEGEATSFVSRRAPPEDLERMYSGFYDQPALAGAGHPSHLEIETIQKERSVVDSEAEISDLSHHVLVENELAKWRRKGRSNYLNYSWPLQLSHGSSTIFRVPKNLRDCDHKAYEPTILTIGLFHFHKGPELSPQLHKHKSDCVSHLLARQGNEKAGELLEQCMRLVLTLEPRARRCYSVDDGNVGALEFAEMLLQDGCFILCLLLQERPEVTPYPMIDSCWIHNLVGNDLIKLENQIPFFVVQCLFDLLKTPAEKDIDLVELALQFLSGVNPARANTFKPPPSSAVLHLLHLFHSSLIPPKLEDMTLTKAPDWIPSATVLKDAGIKFRQPKEGTADSFLDVTFENGVMEIPPLLIEDSTSSIFRNLIAFEQFYPYTGDHVTSYASFMDDLINTTRDVRLLSLDGVMLNWLGTEEAVADFFNKICDQVFYDSNMNYLGKALTDVAKYYESPWHKWRATFFQNYFSNPWTIISVVAAGVLLLLTIEQAVFAGLSYFCPPS